MTESFAVRIARLTVEPIHDALCACDEPAAHEIEDYPAAAREAARTVLWETVAWLRTQSGAGDTRAWRDAYAQVSNDLEAEIDALGEL
jgi:hypothetical protein